ncbi:hypothetical protein CR513_57224, partial [Mucuna pruriens]
MTNDYNLFRDKAKRNIVPPKIFAYTYLIYYALNVEALDSKESENWLEEMTKEMHSVEKKYLNSCLTTKKSKDGGQKARFKVRFVAKGFSQLEGVDFNEIFSLVVNHYFIRILLSIVTQFDLELEQLDVKTAFLHGDLEETIYM